MRHTPPSQSWLTFLAHHARDLVSLDFFAVPTACLRVLFVRVAPWTAQQIVDAFPDDAAPSYLLDDCDTVYGYAFRQRVKGMGIREVPDRPRLALAEPPRGAPHRLHPPRVPR
jgi:hypothetical protein